MNVLPDPADPPLEEAPSLTVIRRCHRESDALRRPRSGLIKDKQRPTRVTAAAIDDLPSTAAGRIRDCEPDRTALIGAMVGRIDRGLE
jgi:hypothetical protein